ncbi:MAG: Maf family protein [Pseudomonadales bacterium]
MTSIVLASASPRRRELLTQLGVAFDLCSADIDERVAEAEGASEYVERMAREKCELVFSRTGGGRPVLGADTSVICDHRILGKPVDRDDALSTLALLSGRWHRVITSVALCSEGMTHVINVESRVKFCTLTEQQCSDYWATGEPHDKAGSYAIQGIGGCFVEQIEGSYSAIVGLPLAQTAELLKQHKVPIWQFN